MVMPVEQTCPKCGNAFMGSDCLGQLCNDCHNVEAMANGRGAVEELYSVLVLIIGRTAYICRRVEPEPGDAKLTWTLQRANAEPHTITVLATGQIECGCADFFLRRQHRGQQCKHITALSVRGLLPGWSAPKHSEPTCSSAERPMKASKSQSERSAKHSV